MSLKTLFIAAFSISALACVSRADIEELKKNQKDILSKLDTLPAGGGRAAPARPQVARPDASKTYAVPVEGAAVQGPKDAWVTIVEVSDFQCPYCKRVGPTLAQVKEKYGNDVRIAFKHNALSFHQRAKPAARAAECAGEQGKFWEMHDALFENQKALEDAQLEEYAGKIGLSTGKWKSCYTSNKYDAKIDADQRTAVSFGARGTPAFFINGRFLSGAQPFPAFETLIEEELKKAKGSGISRGEYYARAVMEKGLKKL